MLSVEQMREILGDPCLSDEQLLVIREDLYAWLNQGGTSKQQRSRCTSGDNNTTGRNIYLIFIEIMPRNRCS